MCIGCKGCSRDCPSEVDMAKMKAEVTHAHHQRHGADLRARIFANVDTLAELGFDVRAALEPRDEDTRRAEGPGGDSRNRRATGRSPSFHRELRGLVEARPRSASRRQRCGPEGRVLRGHVHELRDPEVGRAAIRVLEAATSTFGFAESTDSGRPAHSKGFSDKSRAAAEQNVAELAPEVKAGWDVVAGRTLGRRDVPVGLPRPALGRRARRDASPRTLRCLRVSRRVPTRRAIALTTRRSLAYHGHCHQKATKKDHHAVGVLRRAGYDVDPLDSGCCGMAGLSATRPNTTR